MQGWRAAIEQVQVLDQAVYAFVLRKIEQVPVERSAVVPFVPLGELAAHEQ